jgi:hypothetical protein
MKMNMATKLASARTLVVLVACASLSVLSCAEGTRAPAAPDDNGGVTSADPATGTTAPATTTVSRPPAAVVPLPMGAGPSTDPTSTSASPGETESPPPSPAVLEAVSAASTKLGAITAGLDGTKVRFVDCAETSSCTARLEAPSLAALRDLLQGVSAQQGGIAFVAREQLDAYMGPSFIADVTLGGTSTRPVPTDENELLVNNAE